MDPSTRLLYLYLGRRGAMARFALDLAQSVQLDGEPGSIVIARDNELAHEFDALHIPVLKLRLFEGAVGAIFELGRIAALRQEYARFITATRASAVVELMPHIWSPFFEDVPRRLGLQRIAVLHDWDAHPGDATGIVNTWLVRSALRADQVVTLSRYVADKISERGALERSRITPLFHPDIGFPVREIATARPVLHVLVFGRLLAYKGLDLCIEAIGRARARGAALQLTLAGEGNVECLRPALERVGAVVINRWLAEEEIGRMLADCDVVAATHREASQSGVVAAAFGAGRPVVVTPVGALPEQVRNDHNGLVAGAITVDAIADVFLRLATDRALLGRLTANVIEESPKRTMRQFAEALAQLSRRAR